ncbi:fluoride efflux transporter CrcB [Candidatus Nitrosotenuis chungbukensis]|uniref:fluoride efflux transporter CrcB n=1 Tax=Candidatus Nitrosotenuis chungbukensis TaxID=1353246 RepID=UPI002673BB42|nr:fluoride efflux transporter CrcB [Candidatus Nitrosotenuis chungbukensis]WKT58428.1 fluoride efflux transporter CrcB [Candidatus Nitrosotenuis chungbukensis]
MKGLEIVFLSVGGVLGTFLRYKITDSQMMLGTLSVSILVVNIIGAFILGMFVVLAQQWNLEAKYALFVAVGFCGSLTTMSAFALQTTNLMDNSQFGLAAINIMANVGLSIGALMAGRMLMSHIASA